MRLLDVAGGFKSKGKSAIYEGSNGRLRDQHDQLASIKVGLCSGFKNERFRLSRISTVGSTRRPLFVLNWVTVI